MLFRSFGTSGQLDPLLAAFRLPDIVYGLVAAGSFSTVLVPALANLHARGQTDRARALLGAFAAVVVALLAGALSGVGMAVHDLPIYFADVDLSFAQLLVAAMIASSAVVGGCGAHLVHRALRRSGALAALGA